MCRFIAGIPTPMVAVLAGVGLLCAAQSTPAPLPRIDAHVHVAPPPEAFLSLLDRLDVRLVNVTVVDPHAPGFDRTEPQTGLAMEAVRQSRGRIAWIATFDPSGFETPGFAAGVEAELLRAFEQGAVGVKIYKSIGMDLQAADGRYVLPDDPAFSPILDLIQKQGRTLLAHLAEPRSSWLPLDPNDLHYGYYRDNPDWHMYRHPERPSWQDIIAARDRMLEAHPGLRVVGCHLGSMEHDVDVIAERLERYPNFVVDTAARMPDLMVQPRDKVREFLIRYQDRVLWGTDLMELTWADPNQVLARWESVYDRDWRYLATTGPIRLGGERVVQGLGLPEPVLRKIVHDNALRWLPGLQPSAAALIDQYLEALGGRNALERVTSRGAQGSFFAPTYGSAGSYQEFAAAPDNLVRKLHVDGYGVTQTCVQGDAGWAESPEYGVEELSPARIRELRVEAELSFPLSLRSRFAGMEAVGRVEIEGRHWEEVKGVSADGIPVTFWFDPASRLLHGIELPETARDGSAGKARYFYEDYRSVDGVLVPHRLRYVGQDLIWVSQRGIAHNLQLGATPFQRPAN